MMGVRFLGVLSTALLAALLMACGGQNREVRKDEPTLPTASAQTEKAELINVANRRFPS